jgi:hypothetical protein
MTDSQLGNIFQNVSRVREIDPMDAEEDVWEIQTPPASFTYRAIWSTRLPGEVL